MVLGAALFVVALLGAALAVNAWLSRRSNADRARGDAEWTHAAGDEVSGLSEPARCDLIFAVSALDDERSQRLLVQALDDPCEAVSLAAAHALHSRGEDTAVERYLAAHPGDRSTRIAQTLALLTAEP